MKENICGMQIVREIPEKSDVITINQRLKKYIEPVDQKWIKAIVPASEESIAILKYTSKMLDANLDFPKSFLEFAKYAGESDGGLLSKLLGGGLSITSLIERNEKIYINETDKLHPYCIDFLYDELELAYSMNLGNEKNQTIFLEGGYEISDSFENLLFQCAVSKYEKNYFKENSWFSASIESYNASNVRGDKENLKNFLDKFSNEYKLTKAWFSDSCCYFAYSNEISLFLRNLIGISGRICCDDRLLLEKIKQELKFEIGVVIKE